MRHLPLPQELWEVILSDLREMDDLCSFCLVAQRFRDPSQQRIFETVLLGHSNIPSELDERWNAFFKAVTASPQLASYVKTIQVVVTNNPNANSIAFALFLDVVPILSGVKRLFIEFCDKQADLSGVATQSLQGTSTKPVKLPSLHFLYLSGIKNLPLSLLEGFSSATTMVWRNVTDIQSTLLMNNSSFTPLAPFVLPQTLMLAPYQLPHLFSTCRALVTLPVGSGSQGQTSVDISKLRNLFLQLPYDPHLHRFPPDGFESLQMFLEAVSQRLQCLEVSWEEPTAFRFCNNPRSQALRLYNLRRLSIIFDVDEKFGVDVRAVVALVDWIKAITACKDLEEFHLSLNGPNDESDSEESDDESYDEESDDDESDINWYDLLQETFMPSLLDLEAHFTSGTHFKRPPRVKISLKDGTAMDLKYVQSSLARLEMSGLEVVKKGQGLGSSAILGRGEISVNSEDLLTNESPV
ncbi:hypothetical protein BKA70DRAFT_1293852 [Coprinopsis sp. MPI-PUGE-AT-0042]|nr:hypothetical protein BKA70DRAFT_1293852 [Coprinopsis sp. MPI-PUGE-AT-0042]